MSEGQIDKKGKRKGREKLEREIEEDRGREKGTWEESGVGMTKGGRCRKMSQRFTAALCFLSAMMSLAAKRTPLHIFSPRNCWIA